MHPHAAPRTPPPGAAHPALVAELIQRLTRTTFLLSSARLVIEDPAACATATESVNESLATLVRAKAQTGVAA